MVDMTRRRKATLWLGLCLSLPGAAYAFLGFVYFVWLGGLQQAPAGRAGIFALVALGLGFVCAGAFVYCLLALCRNPHRVDRKDGRTT